MSIRLSAAADTVGCGIDVEHGGCTCGAADHLHPEFLASLRTRTQQLTAESRALFSDDVFPQPPRPHGGGGAAAGRDGPA